MGRFLVLQLCVVTCDTMGIPQFWKNKYHGIRFVLLLLPDSVSIVIT